MANYICSCRSNYFKVKDKEKFLAWTASISEISARIEASGKNKGRAVILGNDPDGVAGLATGSMKSPRNSKSSTSSKNYPNISPRAGLQS